MTNERMIWLHWERRVFLGRGLWVLGTTSGRGRRRVVEDADERGVARRRWTGPCVEVWAIAVLVIDFLFGFDRSVRTSLEHEA